MAVRNVHALSRLARPVGAPEIRLLGGGLDAIFLQAPSYECQDRCGRYRNAAACVGTPNYFFRVLRGMALQRRLRARLRLY